MGDAPRAIMMGDFNDFENSPMWQVVMQGGFADMWRSVKPEAEGFSCCQHGDLGNAQSVLNQRIDYVFARGFGQGERSVVGDITLIGYRPSDKVIGPTYPVWPSDHAGLVATLVVPPAE
jgi:endonuclease/exonuclease/phosphatase family metal-dependent hydrolase